MEVLVPVSRFSVSYVAGRGRPYSPLEALALRGIAEGLGSVDALHDALKIHRRLVTEALVTLIQGGFVALKGGADASLVVTHEGEDALKKPKLRSAEISAPQRAGIVMERLTGALAPTTEVRFLRQHELNNRWAETPRLAPELHHNRLDEAQVRPLLRSEPTEWVQWIGPIRLLAKEEWVGAQIDPTTGMVVGIADRWTRRLVPVMLDRAAALGLIESRPTEAPAAAAPAVEGSSFQLPELTGSDLLVGSDEHEHELRRMLEEASSSVFIGGSRVSIAGLEAVRQSIVSADRRDVRVDIRWSAGDASDELLDWLKKLRYDEKLGLLHYNLQAPPDAIDLVIADRSGSIEAIVGSETWLAGPPTSDAIPVSVLIRDQRAASSLCLTAGDALAAVPGAEMTSGPGRWASMAASAEAALADGVRAETGGLVLGLDHGPLLRELAGSSSDRLLIAAAGPVAERLAAGVRPGVMVVVSTVGDAMANAEAPFAPGTPGVRPGALVADDQALVGSDPWLDAAEHRIRRVSMRFRGAAVDRLAALLALAV